MAPKASPRRGHPKRHPAPAPAAIPRPAATAEDRAAEAKELSAVLDGPQWNDPEAIAARRERGKAFLRKVSAAIQREKERETSLPLRLSRAETMVNEVVQERWESRLKELSRWVNEKST
jgi:hypothetical protein